MTHSPQYVCRTDQFMSMTPTTRSLQNVETDWAFSYFDWICRLLQPQSRPGGQLVQLRLPWHLPGLQSHDRFFGPCHKAPL